MVHIWQLFFADVTGQDVDVQLVFNNAGFIVTGQEWAGYRWRKVGRLAKTLPYSN
jgi:hypothetical protein